MTIPMQRHTELSIEHTEELFVQSVIDPETAEARGYRTLEGSEEDRAFLASLGFTSRTAGRDDAYPGLLIPMHKADGSVSGYQFKPRVPRSQSTPEGKPRTIKYETPRGAVNVLDVPAFTRSVLKDPDTPLWITEGMKKTDSLVSQGKAAIGLTGVFNWRSKLGTLGDWEDIPLKGRQVVICFDADAKTNRNVQLAMKRFGAWLESKGVTAVHYLIVPGSVNGTDVKGVDDFFAAGGTLEELKEASSRSAPTTGPADASFTDAQLTDTVCEDALEGRYIWSRGLGWMQWTGCVWREISDTAPTEAVRLWALEQFTKALSEQKTDPSRDMGALIAGWRSVLSKGRIKALVDLSRGVLEKDPGDFDVDKMLLNTPTGIVDLRTGDLRPSDPDALMTKCTKADYVPGATHPMWDKALEALPECTRAWHQDRIGQSITGYMTSDGVLVISHGDGENGKSTVVDALMAALGSYAIQVSDKVLMPSSDAHTTEMMDLRGARYAVLEETPDARRLDVNRLKKLTDTSYVTARRIRQDPVTFEATHSLFINTNYKPVVTETDRGTWRRLALLSFPYTFKKPHQPLTHQMDRAGDPAVRDVLKTDRSSWSAVLSWAVQGAVMWHQRGRKMLPPPHLVESDTSTWRSETDLIQGFAAEMLAFTRDGVTQCSEMRGAFNEWAGARGHKETSERVFAAKFKSHELIKTQRVERSKTRTAGNGKPEWCWTGVTVRKDEGPFNESDIPDEPGQPEGPENSGCSTCSTSSVNQKIDSITRVFRARGTHGTAVEHPRSEEGDDKTDTASGAPEADPRSPSPAASPERGTGDGTPSWNAPAANTVRENFVSGELVGFDLETGSKRSLWDTPDPGFVRIVGTGDRVDDSADVLRARLEAGQVLVGHNVAAYDAVAADRHTGLPVEAFNGRIRDIRLQAWIADPPNSYETTGGRTHDGTFIPRKHYSLDALSERVLGEPKDVRGKELVAEYCTTPRCTHSAQASDCNGWDSIPRDDTRYRAYCADDADRALRIHKALPWTPYMEREMS